MKYMVCVDDSDGAQKALERTAQVSKPEDHVTLVSAYTMPSDQHVVSGGAFFHHTTFERGSVQHLRLLLGGKHGMKMQFVRRK